MKRLLALLVPMLASGALFATDAPQAAPVAATVETTLKTDTGKIRQFAFDGDLNSFFVSAHNPTAADHFTLVFDEPVAMKSIMVATGRPKQNDWLDAGVLEVSADGKTFSTLAKFMNGVARAVPERRKVRALRVRPTADLQHPLAIGEIVIDSEPQVAVFKNPIEFIVDVSDAPEMKEWAENVARVCSRES